MYKLLVNIVDKFSNSNNQSQLIIIYVITEMAPIIDYFFSYNIHYFHMCFMILIQYPYYILIYYIQID